MSKWLPVVLIGLFGIAWFSNTALLLNYFPYSNGTEFYKFMEALIPTYEVMFLTLLTALYLISKGVMKAMSCFFMILVLASVIDKVIFRITWYLWTDILLVVLALIVSWVVWKKHG